MNSSNANRNRTRAVISSLPGIHLRMLQRILGTSFSTVRYHVYNLEKEGEVIRRSDSRYERFYPRGTAEAMQSLYSMLHRKTVRDLLHAAVEDHHQNTTVADLVNRTGLATSTVTECIKQLDEVGLVVRSRGSDGRLRYEIRDRDFALHLLAKFRRNMINVASDNLIDLWNF